MLPAARFHIFWLSFFIICACSQKPKDKDPGRPAFVFISTCVNEDFFKPVKKGMNDAAALLDVNCTFIGTPGVDAKAQAHMVDSAIDSGADGIAVNIIDSVAFDEVIAKAIAKGIPVVAFNSDDNYTDNKRLSSVCQDLYMAGLQFGKSIEKDIAQGSTVIITVHSDGISALEERVKGIKEALGKKDLKFTGVVTTNIIDSATKNIAAALEKNPGVKAILYTGLADTEGAGNVIENYHLQNDVIAAGFDLSGKILDHVEKGNLLFTIDQQPYMQGFLPVVQLAHYKKYGILPSSNHIGASFVTKQNVSEVKHLTAKGYR